MKYFCLLLHMLCMIRLSAALDTLNVDTYLKSYRNFSGVVLIAQDGNIMFKKGYGYANYEFDIPNTPETEFCIASNTKSFTALAIMQLQERNILNVQDKLSTYIPDFAHGDDITIHHLLTHTSGIPNYYKHWADVCDCTSLEAMITRFKLWDLEFEPGSSYSYSNSNYTLLAYIIEKVSKITYAEFLWENIFKPLGMYNTGSNHAEFIVKNRACGYIIKDTIIFNVPPISNPITLLGNGDLYASIDDMYKWDQALYTEKIMSKKGIATMFTPHVPMANSVIRAHGYGWFVGKKRDKRVVEYSGALIGFLSKIMRFIDDGVTIIILTNLEDQNQFCKICDDLPTMVFDVAHKFVDYNVNQQGNR